MVDVSTVPPIQRAPATPALSHTIESIQHLRALAALGVVLFHALVLMEPYFGIQIAHRSLGAAGVDLFFIISGFIMWVTAIARDESPARFAWKRVVRIVPLYWLVTTLVLALVTLKPSLMNSASRDPLHFVASYLFVAWPHPTDEGRYWPPVIPGWTLNYEMFFYLVVTLSLLLPRLRRIPFILIVLAGLPLIGSMWQQTGAAAFYTNPILLEFLYGVGLGFLFTNGRGQGRRVSLVLMAAGALLFFTVGLRGDEANRALWWALPLALLMQGALHAPALARGAPRAFSLLVGDASYSLYLTQFIVLPPSAKLLGRALKSVAQPLASVAFVGGLLAAAIVAALASYYLVEKPILDFAHRARARAREKAAA
jgi:exopolysaccharide production protein ExoZ